MTTTTTRTPLAPSRRVPCPMPGCERGAIRAEDSGRILGTASNGETVYSGHRVPMWEMCPVCRGAGLIDATEMPR